MTYTPQARATYLPPTRFGRFRKFICALIGHKWAAFDEPVTIVVCLRCGDGRYVNV